MSPPKARSELCAEILSCSRQLMLSTQITQTCLQNGSQRQLEFVRDLFAQELEQRAQNRISRLIRKAAFPAFKTLENYEDSAIRFPDDFTLDMISSSEFVTTKTNLVLLGPVGTGKTHLAIAAGVCACHNGLATRFYTVAALVRTLGEAARTGKLDKLLRDLNKLDLLILDEWGYVPIDREGAQLLFQVIADSYETKSLVITTNLEFSRWGSVLTDDQMAAAMIDRLAHHGRLLLFEGSSYRMEHALMRGTSQPA